MSRLHSLGKPEWAEELTAFYDLADLFLCASEHEGFCVPLVRMSRLSVMPVTDDEWARIEALSRS